MVFSFYCVLRVGMIPDKKCVNKYSSFLNDNPCLRSVYVLPKLFLSTPKYLFFSQFFTYYIYNYSANFNLQRSLIGFLIWIFGWYWSSGKKGVYVCKSSFSCFAIIELLCTLYIASPIWKCVIFQAGSIISFSEENGMIAQVKTETALWYIIGSRTALNWVTSSLRSRHVFAFQSKYFWKVVLVVAVWWYAWCATLLQF